MVNLFDIASRAGNGTWFDAMARQVGLNPHQTQAAVEALLPAFTLAFQRNAANPAAFAGLLGMVGSGQYAPFYDAGGRGRAGAGETVLAQLFGSRQVADGVAAQASALTGIGAEVMRQLLPSLAATLVGGMFRYATVEGFADLLRQWSDAIKAANPPAKPPRPASSDPWSAWADAIGATMGVPARRELPPQAGPATWPALLTDMLGGPAKAPPPSPAQPNPFEALARMFDSGREVQAQHLATLEAIMGGGSRPPGSR